MDSRLQSILARARQSTDISVAQAEQSSSDVSSFPVTNNLGGMEPENEFDSIDGVIIHEEVEHVRLEEPRVTTARFSSAVWFDKMQEKRIIVGGQGGISSWFTLLAARMNPDMLITFDDDTVEAVNMAGQFFSSQDVGRPKVSAISRHVFDYANYHRVDAIQSRYDSHSPTEDIMVCGFDNMAARNVFFNNWKNHVADSRDKAKCLYIDGRLSAETLQVFCITGDASWDMERYEREYLFDDSEAEHAVCSFKQTAFVANMIAGIMTNLLANFCANECGGCRALPFYTSYEAETMYLREEGGV